MATEPKHRTISRQILHEIGQGRYGATGRLPSEAQLVERFGVSRPTIARALRDLQQQGVIQRRAGSGTFLRGDNPGATGNRQLGLLIPGLGTTLVFDIICGELASLTRTHDYNLLWGGAVHPTHDMSVSVQDAEEVCNRFIGRNVAGVFFAPFDRIEGKDEINRRLADRLHQEGMAVVLLDRDLVSFPARSEFDVVGVDNFAGGYLLAEHLLKLGCRRFRFVARLLTASTADARAAGAREALLTHGLEVPKDFVRRGSPADLDFVASLFPGTETDTLICSSDSVAALLMQSLAKMNLRVPSDVRVVGFDDTQYATLLSVPLTTIHQPCREIAVAAFRVMLDRMADPALPPRNVSLAPRLVVRETCGAYLQHGAAPA
jgi:LacI family transcriptional regulator